MEWLRQVASPQTYDRDVKEGRSSRLATRRVPDNGDSTGLLVASCAGGLRSSTRIVRLLEVSGRSEYSAASVTSCVGLPGRGAHVSPILALDRKLVDGMEAICSASG